MFVSLFLVVFLPFGSEQYVREGRTWILWGYGLVTSLVLIFNMLLLPKIFPGIFIEAKWNVFKGICLQFLHIIFIGTANILYSNLIIGNELNISEVLNFFLATLAIGFFPVVMGVLSAHYFLLIKYVGSAEHISEKISLIEDQKEYESENPLNVLITSETGKEETELSLKDLLFIKAIDNYIEIYRKNGDNTKTIVLRSTLTRIEEALNMYPFLFRCHRSYLVNINSILRVTGNSQGYRLLFKGVDYSIPVSRNYSKKLLRLIV
ncbi:LytR/AlgR family response regulator transcription factor [candidate division KSB1 bacterium]